MDKKYVEIGEVKECIHAVQKYRENISRVALDLDTDGAMIKILQRVEQIPAADVEKVVRCKECRSYNKHYGECTLYGSHLGENGFCSSGIKKEGANNGVGNGVET